MRFALLAALILYNLHNFALRPSSSLIQSPMSAASSIFSEVKKVTICSVSVVAIGLMAYALAQWRTVIDTDDSKTQRPANLESLPLLMRAASSVSERSRSQSC